MNSFFCIYLCLVEAAIYRTELEGGGGLSGLSKLGIINISL